MIRTIDVSVYSLVNPTERVERVAAAIERIFPSLIMNIQDERIEAHGGPEAIENFRKLLREQRILDTARSVMFEGKIGNKIQFSLNKQAAFMGKLSFPPEEEPLGSIHVQISGSDETIDWLAPRTKDGRPIRADEVLRDV
ncbi:MAG: hypothetical protein LUQ38_09765 [Methanotrichaceae archaeon]|nr:hypothetical protein [Methanotrichaceae archaeon]MDD1758043.1 hypothetical protein [Methanotrichaceae archaeon]